VKRPPSQGSLLVSGGSIDVSHATGTVVCAPELVKISHANGVTFVNSPRRDVSHQADCDEAEIAGLRLAPAAARQNPLGERLTLKQAARAGAAGGRAVFQWGGAEVVFQLGGDARDGNGRVVPELEGWKLTFVTRDSEGFALLSRGREDAAYLTNPQGR
jgi:hypothetical protein